MATIAFAAAGAYVGSYFGYGAVGWAIGSMIGNYLYPPSGPAIEGPRLNDLKVQSSAYGNAIPLIYGTIRISGNVVWASEVVEHEHKEESGGKGGGGQEYTTYTYTASLAISLCEGPIAGIGRVWADGKLVENRLTSTTSIMSGKLWSYHGGQYGTMRVYSGGETQEPDSLLEAHLGVGNVPAYRGQAYVVLENLNLTEFGNRIPNLTFEVVRTGTPTPWKNLVTETTFYPTGGANWLVYDTRLFALGWHRFGLWASSDGAQWETLRDGNPAHAGLPFSFVAPALVFGGAIWVFGFPSGGSPGTAGQHFTLDGGFNWLSYGVLPPWGVRYRHSAVVFNGEVYLGCGSTSGADADAIGDFWKGRWSDTAGAFLWEPMTVNPPWGKRSRVALTVWNGKIWLSGGVDQAGSFKADVWSTTNGRDWTLETDAPGWTPRCAHGMVGHAGFLWVAGGNDNPATGIENPITLWRSRDGKEWELYQTAFVSNRHSFGLLVWNGKLVLVGGLRPTSGVTDGVYAVEVMADLLAPGVETLSAVVGDLSARVGLTGGDLDTAPLTDVVEGYVVAARMSARESVEALRTAYVFDAVESDHKIKFAKRGGAPVAIVPEDDLAAHEGDAVPDPLPFARAQELELPRSVSVLYIDKTTDYQQGHQQSQRMVTASREALTVELPIVLGPDQARRIAERLLLDAWVARDRIDPALSRKYARLEPSDVIEIPRAGITLRARVVRKDEGRPGIVRLGCELEEASAYTSEATGGSPPPPDNVIEGASGTALVLLDIALLRDHDDDVGFYAAARGYLPGWDGAVLYKSSDAGQTYGEVGTFTDAAVLGRAVTALASFAGGNVFDEHNSVDVFLPHGGALSSVAELVVLNGANAALLGNEVLQFRSATLIAANTYRLSGLLRARSGTQWALGGHAENERFVLLTAGGVRRVAAPSGEIGLERLYKAVTFGLAVDQAVERRVTLTAASKKPLAPVLIGGGRDGSNNIVIAWTRRTRTGGAWTDYVDALLGESAEQYEIEIMSGSVVKRTLTSATPTVTYSNADQVTDFGASPTSLTVRIYQMSAVVGRGYVAVATLSLPTTAPVGNVWLNPADKCASVALSNANFTATATVSSWASVRATVGRSAGKWYFELRCDNSTGYKNVGVGLASAQICNLPGYDANGRGYHGANGQKYVSSVGTAYGAIWGTSGDVIGIALDLDAGTLTFYKNGASQGVAFTGLTGGPWYPMIGVYGGATVTARFAAPSFTYAPPAGFAAWDS